MTRRICSYGSGQGPLAPDFTALVRGIFFGQCLCIALLDLIGSSAARVTEERVCFPLYLFNHRLLGIF